MRKEAVALQMNSWIEHPTFGIGQIHHDSEPYWAIRFISHGERKIQKTFALKPSQPPSADFVFPKDVPVKAKRKKAVVASETEL